MEVKDRDNVEGSVEIEAAPSVLCITSAMIATFLCMGLCSQGGGGMWATISRSFTKPVFIMDPMAFSLTRFWSFDIYETQMLAKICAATTVVQITPILD